MRNFFVFFLLTIGLPGSYQAYRNTKHGKKSLEDFLTVQPLHTTTTCKPSISITCWTSCSFAANCWGYGDHDAYIYCQWNAPPEFNQNNYVVHLKAANSLHNHCVSNLSCNEQGPCHTYIRVNTSECYFATTSDHLRFSIEITSVNNTNICWTHANFRPCDVVRINPPEIDDISTEEMTLNIQMKPSVCQRHSWGVTKYKLFYSSSNGEITHHAGPQTSSSNFRLHLQEAQEYNITVISAIDDVSEVLKIWSKPVNIKYLTAPSTATDLSYIDLGDCTDKGKSMFSATAQWQKKGIVKKFILTLRDLSNSTLPQVFNITKTFHSQEFFQVMIQNMKKGSKYQLELVAENDQGISEPFYKDFSHETCNKTGVYIETCDTVEKGGTWMKVQWRKPAKSGSYTGFRIRTLFGNSSIATGKLSPVSNGYNITHLQACMLYTHTIQQLHGDMVIGSCRLHSYTVGPVPMTHPNLKRKHVTTSTATYNVLPMDPNLQCGDVTKITATYWKTNHHLQGNYTIDVMAPAKQIKLKVLEPLTSYSVVIAAQNSAGIGPYSPVFTFETLPPNALATAKIMKIIHNSDGQYFVQWKQLDGVITNPVYTMKITSTSEIQQSDVQCVDKHRHECYYITSQQNATLPLPSHSYIQLSACTENETLCSNWSDPVELETNGDLPVALIVTLSAVVVILFLLGGIYFICLRKYKDPLKGLNEMDILPRDLPNLKNDRECIELQMKEEYEPLSTWATQTATEGDCMQETKLLNNQNENHMEVVANQSTSDLGNEATCSIETRSSSHDLHGEEMDNPDAYVDLTLESDKLGHKNNQDGSNSEDNEFEFDIPEQWDSDGQKLFLHEICGSYTDSGMYSGQLSSTHHREQQYNMVSEPTMPTIELFQQYNHLLGKESLL